MNLTPTDRKKLAAMLGELLAVLEDELRTGLVTASEQTRQTLSVTFQEASRLRLLRLGSTLRLASDEMGKLVRNDADFSRSRFAFFLNRTWLLARGLSKALAAGDDATFDKLLWTPPQKPVETVEVATLGVVKKVVPGTFVMFDFRMRVVASSPGLAVGQRISWSTVFPLKPGQDVPAEAFLHLPTKQKFTASQFLEETTMVLEKVAAAGDDAGGARLSLGDASVVKPGKKFDPFESLLTWDRARAIERIEKHEPTPFDLEVEMQEEIVLRDWKLGKPEVREADKQVRYPLETGGVELTAIASAQDDGKSLRKYLDELGKEKKPAPLFGLMHYEKCRLMFQPLTAFGPKGRIHLMLSADKVDKKTLLRAMSFG
jgi:hypothetical protein